MSRNDFTPQHMNATADDLAGNNGLGRYILLPGSDGRAAEISEHFEGRRVRTHPRQHNVYMGTIPSEYGSIDVAAVSTGMGTPSVDIIVNELYRLGGKRFLRVGTSGSLQPSSISIGTVVIATAAVRDEHATAGYMPPSVPAVASLRMVEAARRACSKTKNLEYRQGTVHSKASLYARELEAGPLKEENRRFMEQLAACGVLASEMECSMLFTLAAVFSRELLQDGSNQEVEAGALLSIIGDETAFGTPQQIREAEERSILLGLETIRERDRMRHDHSMSL